jgi:hypothetical protein
MLDHKLILAISDALFQDLEQVTGEEDFSDGNRRRGSITQSSRAIERVRTNEPSPITEHKSGIGLGLSMVARFVQLRDGQLRMKSTKDVGTVVTLYIPWLLCSDPVNSYRTLQSLPTPPGETPLLFPQQAFSPPISAALRPEDTESQTPMEGFFDHAVQGSAYSHTSRVNPTTPLSATSPLYSNETPNHSPILERRPSMVIAIADDNNINLQVLKRRLERMGHKVLSSRDGKECLEVFKEQKESMQFILMDIDMPLGLFLRLPFFTLKHLLIRL